MLITHFITKNQNNFYKLTTDNNGKYRNVVKYVVAIFACFLGVLFKIFLTKTIHYPEGGFLISLGTIMISAWYGGFGPGFVAVFVNYFISDWFFITPQKLFFNDTLVDQVRFIFFFTEGILISWLFELLQSE